MQWFECKEGWLNGFKFWSVPYYLLNNKFKRWAFFAVLFFLLLSLDDYSILTLNVPAFNQLNVSEGIVQIQLARGGGKGAIKGDILYLLNNQKRIKFNCQIGTRDNSSCITKGNNMFYDKTYGSDSWFGKTVYIKPNTSKKIIHGRAWWYEANIFGPLKEKRLLQLDVGEKRLINYEQQKTKYLLKKRKHDYMPTILFIFSIIWFCVLQFTNQSLIISKEK